VVPHETLKSLWRSGDRPSAVFAVDAATAQVIDRYEVPKTAIVFTPQFVPDPTRTGPRGGWLFVMAWTSERAELWILDAENVAQGPLWKLHADELVVGLTVHSAWLDKVGPRTAGYRVDVRADLDPAVAWRGSLVRDLFTNEVYPHFP
jgi:carotenoid cleavage dioxygenase-like enzyme